MTEFLLLDSIAINPSQIQWVHLAPAGTSESMEVYLVGNDSPLRLTGVAAQALRTWLESQVEAAYVVSEALS